MKIFITGGVGFVGRHLSQSLLDKGHHLVAVALRRSQKVLAHANFHYISADTTQKGAWQEAVQEVDAVVNLAGKPIAGRWNRRYKQLIYDSRILTTRNLVEALPENKQIVFCSASGIGYYGDRGEESLAEAAPNGQDFLARVAADWETEAFRARAKGCRVTTARFGVVLGRNGGALEKMIPAFRSFVGGPLGSGMQWFPWIHIDDLIAAILFALENADFTGPANFCAPNAVRNREFAETLGKLLNRPAVLPVPGFMLRLTFGEFAETLLASQKAVPEKLTKHGYQFRYPDLRRALEAILRA